MAAGYTRPYSSAARGGPTVLWPVGDSITRGARALPPYTGSFVYEGGWRSPLFQAMTAASAQPDFQGLLLNSNETPPVTTAGDRHNGNNNTTTAQWIAAIASTFASAFPTTPPHIITLSTGANDTDTVGTAQAIGTLVDAAAVLAPRANIFIGNVLKRASSSGATVNAQLVTEISTRRGAGMNVTYVDLNRHVPIGPDGLHPSGDGYVIMGRVWISAILSVIT